MAGKFPNIPHKDENGGKYSLEGKLEPGMIICIEGYIGWSKSNEGVKLEDQFLFRVNDVLRMSYFHCDDHIQTRDL